MAILLIAKEIAICSSDVFHYLCVTTLKENKSIKAMAKVIYKYYNPNDSLLLPPCLGDYLPQNHKAHKG